MLTCTRAANLLSGVRQQCTKFAIMRSCSMQMAAECFPMTELQPVPAATVVLVRDAVSASGLEVLLLRRNSKLVFHGGHWVFPGGRVDTEDFANSANGLEYPAALKAAVRETREEAGIELDESRLIHLAHWTTPPRLARRFCTWFFVYPLTGHVVVQVDNDEILEYRWLTPQQALAEADAEKLVLPRPTRVTLEDIAVHQTLPDLLQTVTQSNIRVYPENSDYYKPEEMGCIVLD